MVPVAPLPFSWVPGTVLTASQLRGCLSIAEFLLPMLWSPAPGSAHLLHALVTCSLLDSPYVSDPLLTLTFCHFQRHLELPSTTACASTEAPILH